jgi:two-component Ni(II)/redox sensor kinase NrsS
MNTRRLFARSRRQLALWYALVMGGILGVLGLGVYRSIVQSNWTALEREIESIAGTLHDSLEPMLPNNSSPTEVLQQIFPDLCLANQPCQTHLTLIERHTIGISDRRLYYIRLFDYRGRLLVFSPNQPSNLSLQLQKETWQTIETLNGDRYRQFTTVLHSADNTNQASWGYLQIGRSLTAFDAENRRILLILAISLPIALGLVLLSSWGLAGIAMGPIYRSYQQQQQFTANAAHELRSPLASMIATVEALLRIDSNHNSETEALLHTIERQGRRLSQLIADLLLLSRLEQETSSQDWTGCCLNDLVNDLTEEFSELAFAAEIDLSSKVRADDVYVRGNESQLYRLVSNLIANAIHYTKAGGKIYITLTTEEAMAIITVQDTGIGIASDEQERIFERFYRVNQDRSRQTGGTGLGLAIAQAIAVKHGGSLTVQSELGQGSLFNVRLPLKDNRD